MNILVPDSWLKEHLKTKASAKQITEYLSLCSQSVEKTTKVSQDVVYEIEITTNRSDCLSIYGIARELSAILPRFNIPAKLIPIQDTKYKIPHSNNNLSLSVKITDPSFCPRFTALIFDNIKIGPSSKIVQDRLIKSGIRALNNVVDISNYLMLELGQPMHTFDYDKIKGAKMILREAKDGEKVVTLDGQIRNLSKGAVIIEDGDGRVVDLCGIMGAENSAVDQKTKRVLLFIQTYDPQRIRRTCQLMGFRTEAASRFEKSVDPEGVMIAMKKAIHMFKNNCGARIASNLIDIYPNPPKKITVTLSQIKLNELMGIEIKLNDAKKILEALGFQSTITHQRRDISELRSAINNQQSTIRTTVPHWRYNDISTPEDLIEEIARIYGYHNLPSALPEGEIPHGTQNQTFVWEQRIKNMLRFWGFTEIFNYSLSSEKNLTNVKINPADYLKIANPLSKEWVYLRPSLIPSLLEVIAKNQDEFEKIRAFELTNVYLPRNNHQLPNEVPMLGAALTASNFYQAKGIIEALFAELGIDDFQFLPFQPSKTLVDKVFNVSHTAQIMIKNSFLGVVGEVDPVIATSFGVKHQVSIFDLNFEILAKNATSTKKYHCLPKYPAIIEDLSFVVPAGTQVGDIIQLIKSISSIIQSVELLDSYQDTRTFRITYQNLTKNLTDKEVRKIRGKVIEVIEQKFGVQLKF